MNLHSLEPGEYPPALAVIERERPTYFAVIARAIAAGNTPGGLWTDAADGPASLFMWDSGVICGLAGEADNAQFNSAIANFVSEHILPTNLAQGQPFVKVYYAPDDWEARATNLFGRSVAGISKVARRLYTMGQPKVTDWRSKIPQGYEMQRIDEHLLRSSSLKNLDKVLEEIGCCWPSVGHFLAKGCGFCLLSEERIVCWCTGEYASGRQIGIGIATDEEYRGRGFATLTAAAFVQYCASNDLHPYWDARMDNLPSLTVAEKVGFKRMSDYVVLIIRY